MLINKETEEFKNLDTTLRRLAADNNISNVNSVSISTVTEGLMLKFSYGEDDTIDFDVDVDEDLLVSDEDDTSVFSEDTWRELEHGYVKEMISEPVSTSMFHYTQDGEDGLDSSSVQIDSFNVYIPKDDTADKELFITISSKNIVSKDIVTYFTDTSSLLDEIINAFEVKGILFDQNFDDPDDELYNLINNVDISVPQM